MAAPKITQGTVQVHTRDMRGQAQRVPLTGLICGHFALTPYIRHVWEDSEEVDTNPDYLTITHIHTGLALRSSFAKKGNIRAAKAALKEVYEVSGDLWDFDDAARFNKDFLALPEIIRCGQIVNGI